MEKVNQLLQQHLRCYISYQQNNWTYFIPLAEFAYSNAHTLLMVCLHSRQHIIPLMGLTNKQISAIPNTTDFLHMKT